MEPGWIFEWQKWNAIPFYRGYLSGKMERHSILRGAKAAAAAAEGRHSSKMERRSILCVSGDAVEADGMQHDDNLNLNSDDKVGEDGYGFPCF